MQYRNLSDEALELETKNSVLQEIKLNTKILQLLAEIERRRLYSKSYPSLYEYCVKTLKLSAASAQLRIDTMRAMKIMPEIESKLLTGDLNLSTVASAQTFFRQEKKLGHAYSVAEKKELLQKLENKSVRECIKEFVAISPKAVAQEKRRELTSNITEIKIAVDQELIQKLDHLKALWSHQNPTMTDLELLQKMADLCLKHADPAQKKVRASKEKNQPEKCDILKQKESFSLGAAAAELTDSTSEIPAGHVSTDLPRVSEVDRYVPAQIKRQVWRRDQGRCTYPGCSSKHFLEYDHIRPVSLHGTSTIENLRLLCRAHNQVVAIQQLGFEQMDRFLN